MKTNVVEEKIISTKKQNEAEVNVPPEGLVRGFSHFFQNYGIIPLAVGVVIGTAVNDLVKALVIDIVTPFISLISPTQKLQDFQITVASSAFKVGHAINAFISFIVVALIVYIAAKFVLKNDDLLKKK